MLCLSFIWWRSSPNHRMAGFGDKRSWDSLYQDSFSGLRFQPCLCLPSVTIQEVVGKSAIMSWNVIVAQPTLWVSSHPGLTFLKSPKNTSLLCYGISSRSKLVSLMYPVRRCGYLISKDGTQYLVYQPFHSNSTSYFFERDSAANMWHVALCSGCNQRRSPVKTARYDKYAFFRCYFCCHWPFSKT
jgi:hypothetical protein